MHRASGLHPGLGLERPVWELLPVRVVRRGLAPGVRHPVQERSRVQASALQVNLQVKDLPM